MGTLSIPLSNGKHALIDEEDAELVGGYRWRPTRRLGPCYAIASRRGRVVWMHRLILDAPNGVEVDHINGDRLDNRRSNLRLATRAQNARNVGRQRNNTSGYKGVVRTKDAQIDSWRASIGYDSRVIEIGVFATPEDAARAYDAVAQELHGEYARLNFPDDPKPAPRRRITFGRAGYRGVHWDDRERCYAVSIQVNGKRIRLGSVRDPLEGARLHDAKARELLGDRALLNFPDDPPIEIYRPGNPQRSPYRGVSFEESHDRTMPWRARIQREGRVLHLGQFASQEEAARAYDRAAREMFGTRARLNFPEEYGMGSD